MGMLAYFLGKEQFWDFYTMKNFGIDLQKACEDLGTTVEEYKKAKQQMVL